MSPSRFDSIEGFFTKFKSLVLMIKHCGIERKYDQLILSILSKLGPEYSFFVSTLHATRIVVSNWKIPSLCTFFDSLKKEQGKLIQMGSLKYSKGNDHALIVQVSQNTKSKEKQIVKEKKPKLEIEDESLKLSDED